MLVQNPRLPRNRTEIKFKTLEEYLEFIDKSKNLEKEGFKWYCKFSPVLFYINEKENELDIEGPHIIELCNYLVKLKADKGIKIRLKSSEANWKFNAKLSVVEINTLKKELVLWNELIQNKIDLQGLNEFVIKKEHTRDREKNYDRIIKIIGAVLIVAFFSTIIYYS